MPPTSRTLMAALLDVMAEFAFFITYIVEKFQFDNSISMKLKVAVHEKNRICSRMDTMEALFFNNLTTVTPADKHKLGIYGPKIIKSPPKV